MRTVQATENAVSIWFSQEEAPPQQQVLRLVRSALEERGLAPWPETEAECFAAGADTLVIARPAAHSAGFYFEDLESLLAGALACPDGESDLYAVPDGYILTAAADVAVPALYEFGTPRRVLPDWAAHAAEQGQRLAASDAIATLRYWFSD
ncbi:MAG: adaptor protein MecA [Oscillospiraceae bacterium]|nr:adaptor protein MecA [Oscillospiraceae bacterium]